MSGGTWDYLDMRLADLADELRNGRQDMAQARYAMAGLLVVAGDLLHKLDWHFTGDSTIENEAAWLLGAQARLRDALAAFTPARW